MGYRGMEAGIQFHEVEPDPEDYKGVTRPGIDWETLGFFPPRGTHQLSLLNILKVKWWPDPELNWGHKDFSRLAGLTN